MHKYSLIFFVLQFFFLVKSLSDDEILTIMRASWPDMTVECGWYEYPEPCFWGGVICEEGSGVVELRINSEGCTLNGFIPPEIGLLTNLSFVALNFLNLSGPIPKEVGNLVNLELMDLSYNELNGSIPVEIGNLKLLMNFYVADNHLTGAYPPNSAMECVASGNPGLCVPADFTFHCGITDICATTGTIGVSTGTTNDPTTGTTSNPTTGTTSNPTTGTTANPTTGTTSNPTTGTTSNPTTGTTFNPTTGTTFNPVPPTTGTTSNPTTGTTSNPTTSNPTTQNPSSMLSGGNSNAESITGMLRWIAILVVLAYSSAIV